LAEESETIRAETNVNGAETKVQATIAVATCNNNMMITRIIPPFMLC